MGNKGFLHRSSFGRTSGPPDVKSGCSESAELIALNEPFDQFSGLPFFDLSFPVHRLLFRLVFFREYNDPVFGPGGEAIVIGKVCFEPCLQIGTAVSDIIFVKDFGVEDISVEHFERLVHKKILPNITSRRI